MFASADHTKNTREKVLHTLLARQRCTINELAKEVDINPLVIQQLEECILSEIDVHKDIWQSSLG